MFEEKLIAAVEKHPCLYNKKEKFYRNKLIREKAWAAIEAAVGENKDICQSRWKSLRDRFVKEANKKRSASGSAAEKYMPWILLENMMFLKDHIAPRPTISNIDVEKDIFSHEEVFINNSMPPVQEFVYDTNPVIPVDINGNLDSTSSSANKS